jgi:hypothetical protein
MVYQPTKAIAVVHVLYSVHSTKVQQYGAVYTDRGGCVRPFLSGRERASELKVILIQQI